MCCSMGNIELIQQKPICLLQKKTTKKSVWTAEKVKTKAVKNTKRLACTTTFQPLEIQAH